MEEDQETQQEEFKNIRQYPNERLRDFVKRFRTMVNTTPGLTDKDIINTFANGLRNHNCAASISAKEPKTLGQLMDVLKKATALDDRLTRQ